MERALEGKRVAALVTNGFEQSELEETRRALLEAGASVEVVSPKRDAVRAWNHKDWGGEVSVDRHIDDASVADYDALLLPGGVMNPDYLRMDHRAVRFVHDFADTDKPVGAICHGAWTLVEADVVRQRRMTSFPSLKTDLRNAGATWVDEPAVVDGSWVTSRRPDDLPDFCEAFVDAVARGRARGPYRHHGGLDYTVEEGRSAETPVLGTAVTAWGLAFALAVLGAGVIMIGFAQIIPGIVVLLLGAVLSALAASALLRALKHEGYFDPTARR